MRKCWLPATAFVWLVATGCVATQSPEPAQVASARAVATLPLREEGNGLVEFAEVPIDTPPAPQSAATTAATKAVSTASADGSNVSNGSNEKSGAAAGGGTNGGTRGGGTSGGGAASSAGSSGVQPIAAMPVVVLATPGVNSGGGSGNGKPAIERPDPSGDDIVARRLRRAAEQEQDPELRRKLWQEYVNYRNNAHAP
jgi:hypothetical protein